MKIKWGAQTRTEARSCLFFRHCGGLLYFVEVFNEFPKPLTLLFLHSLVERVLLYQLWNFRAMSVVRMYVFGGTTLLTNPCCGKACIAAKKGSLRVKKNLRIFRWVLFFSRNS